MNTLRKMITAALLLSTFQAAAQSQHVTALLSELKNKPGYQYVPLDKQMLLASMANDKDAQDKQEAASVFSQINRMDIITSDTLQQQLYDQAQVAIAADHYVTVMNVKDEGDNVKIYTDKTGDEAQNLLLLVKDADNCVLMSITGNLKESIIKKLLSQIYPHNGGTDKEDTDD